MEDFCLQVLAHGKRVLAGVTLPIRHKITVVLKSDSAEVPTCVYNELVTPRLGELIGQPAVTEVLPHRKTLPALAPVGRHLLQQVAQIALVRHPSSRHLDPCQQPRLSRHFGALDEGRLR